MRLLVLVSIILLSSCQNNSESKEDKNSNKSSATETAKVIPYTASTIFLDAKASERIWTTTPWQPMDQVWLGETPSPDDFQGRYKLSWNEDYLYVLAETIDDKLIDTHADPLERYWDDDCLEVFIDENRSKGNHQYNHNAFAYHIALDGQVLDIGTDSSAHTYHHVKSKRVTTGNKSVWELAISLYPDTYVDNTRGQALKLSKGKKMGFAIAYCDNDDSVERENFIGSVAVEGEDKNRGWIDAGIFEAVILN